MQLSISHFQNKAAAPHWWH